MRNIVLVAESEGAAAPYREELTRLTNSVSGNAIAKNADIRTLLLPNAIKEAKKADIINWDEVVAPIILEGLSACDPKQDLVLICSNDLSIVTETLRRKNLVPIVDINKANEEGLFAFEIEKCVAADKVAVLATKRLMNSGLFEEGLNDFGRDIVLPSDESQEELDRLIYGPLMKNQMTDEDKESLLDIIEEVQESGANSAICACRLISAYLQQEGIIIVEEKGLSFYETPTTESLPWLDTTSSVPAQAIKQLIIE